MSGMAKKKNLIFVYLSKVISRLTALRQRTHHPTEICIRSHHVCIASVFWCTSIINNMLNLFRGDAGCQRSPSDAAPAVDPGKSCFSAALSLWLKDAPCPSLAQTVCIFLTVFSSSLLWRGFSIPGQWVDYHKCGMLQAIYIHNMHLWKVSLIFFFFYYVSVQYMQQHLTLSPFYYFSTPTYSCFPDSSALVMAEYRDSRSSSITHQYWWCWAHADHQYLILNSVGLLMELWGGGGGRLLQGQSWHIWIWNKCNLEVILIFSFLFLIFFIWTSSFFFGTNLNHLNKHLQVQFRFFILCSKKKNKKFNTYMCLLLSALLLPSRSRN